MVPPFIRPIQLLQIITALENSALRSPDQLSGCPGHSSSHTRSGLYFACPDPGYNCNKNRFKMILKLFVDF